MADSAANLAETVLRTCRSLCDTAAKGERHGQSLGGNNFYGNKFHADLVQLAKIERQFFAAIDSAELNSADLAAAKAAFATIKSTTTQKGKRNAALKSLGLFISGSAAHAFSNQDAPPAPTSEPVLPKAVVTPTKKNHLINIVIQANTCYEARCHDACAVLVRKLVEILIIELYEASKMEVEIKDGNGDYFMLSGLIETLLNSTHWNLGRETKGTLPKLKALGDRAAHQRRFVATTGDLNPVLPGLRVVVDELLHLAGLK